MDHPSFFTTRPNCPSCGKSNPDILTDTLLDSAELTNFLSSYYHSAIPKDILRDQKLRIAGCLCGMIWQMDILNEEGMTLLYEKWIDADLSQGKRTIAKLAYFQSLARNLARCKKLLADIDELKSLDFGMGWGHWANMALAFGFDSYGYELSNVRTAFAEKRGIKCIQNLNNHESNYFHLINAEQVLEHVANPKETFILFSSLLAKGGIVQIAVPDGTKDASILKSGKWKPRKGATQPFEHINTFTPKTLAAMGERVGLEVIKAPFMTLGQTTISASLMPASLYLRFTKTRIFFRKS